MNPTRDDVLDTLAIVRVLYDDAAEPAIKTQELLEEWRALDADGADGSGLLPTVGVILQALMHHTQPDVETMFVEAHVAALATVA